MVCQNREGRRASLSLDTQLTLLALLALLWRANPQALAGKGYLYQALFVVSTLFVSIAREEVRLGALLPVGYNPLSYKVNLDLASTLLFFSTFLGVGARLSRS